MPFGFSHPTLPHPLDCLRSLVRSTNQLFFARACGSFCVASLSPLKQEGTRRREQSPTPSVCRCETTGECALCCCGWKNHHCQQKRRSGSRDCVWNGGEARVRFPLCGLEPQCVCVVRNGRVGGTPVRQSLRALRETRGITEARHRYHRSSDISTLRLESSSTNIHSNHSNHHPPRLVPLEKDTDRPPGDGSSSWESS